MRRLAIAGGGTAGHVTIGLAIMEAYRKEFPGTDMYFIGCAGGFENQLVPDRGFTLEKVPGSPYARQGFSGKARSIYELARGFLRARQVLRQRDTQLVIGLGGYASAGAVLAARSLGIATAVHEANATFGMANRITSKLADLICMGWLGTRPQRCTRRVVFTGNPILAEIGCGVALNPGSNALRILVTGGSEGSPFLNQHVPVLLRLLADRGLRMVVHHQTGAGNGELVRQRYARLGLLVHVEDFILRMNDDYRAAQFAIASAGALTLAELSAAGIPSLIVPTRSVSKDHQQANAAEYAALTGNIWVTERDWNAESLAERLAQLLDNPEALREQSDRSRAHAHPGAAGKVVAACEDLMKGRW